MTSRRDSAVAARGRLALRRTSAMHNAGWRARFADVAPNLRRSPRLARAIAWTLAAKAVALVVIWNVWFSAPETARLDRERVATAIYSSRPAAETESEAHAGPRSR